ncbi:hypothetical protein [Psychroflexus montanilacus]|uniref:hypothetical protein n=1 Tax=Psychroflexus montanilacus TaxID=2873598 RepID=UPI001CCCDD86|nr:hypothetical protein [Psychroflexus montanilacus]MBZ9651582.1 hypothetical protein [Psychroflexus montanilacus]
MLKSIIYLIFIAILISCSSDDDQAEEQTDEAQEFLGEVSIAKTIGGSQQDDFLSVVATPDGGAAAFGFTQSNDGDVVGKSATDSDYWLVKFDENLNIEWQQVFGGSNDDRGQDMISTSDGGFIVNGFTRSLDGDVSQNFGFQDYWVVKLDANGSIQWERSIGYSGNDRGYGITSTKDGGYFATGFLDVTASGGEGNDDFNNLKTNHETALPKHGVGEFWGIKLSGEGEMEWRRYFGGTNNDRSYGSLQTEDGGFIQVGHSESDDFDITNPRGSYDVWVVKTNSNGDLDWQKNFGGSSIEVGYDVIQTDDNNFMLVGDTRSDDQDVSNLKGNADVWVIKFDNEGNKIWENTYGGPNFDAGRSIIPIGNDEYFVTSSSQSQTDQLSSNYGLNDVWTFIIDGSGNLKWQKNIGGTGLDFGNDAAQNTKGEIFVVGSSESEDNDFIINKGDKDAFILKLK